MFGTLFGVKRESGHETCKARYDELADKVDRMARQVRELELEWESTYNKLRSIVARLNKRAEREEANADPVDSNHEGAALGGLGAGARAVAGQQPASRFLSVHPKNGRNY